jgi:hypothetical protein
LKEFGLNLKGKDCFKKSLQKKRKKKLTSLPSQPGGPAAHLSLPQRPVFFFFFFFPTDADIWAPPVSLSPPLSFLLLLPAAQPTRRRRNPRRARPPLHLPFLSARPIKAINLP